MKIGYFPGCAQKGTSKEYHISLSRMMEALGLGLNELADWNCCGATSAHAISQMLALALPLRSLALAEEAGYAELLAPCAACFSRLSYAHKKVQEGPALKDELNRITGRAYQGTVKVTNLLEFIHKHCLEGIRKRLVRPLADLRLAPYYGCLLLRPPRVAQFDDPEEPTTMEEIIDAIGAVAVDWPYKIECCGGGFSVSHTEAVLRLSGEVLENAQEHRADALVTACPMCHSNLDMRQRQIEAQWGRKFNLPILFISEVVGAALGLKPEGLGLGRHFVPALEVLE
jgi:heterodisulfide reductase subunit B